MKVEWIESFWVDWKIERHKSKLLYEEFSAPCNSVKEVLILTKKLLLNKKAHNIKITKVYGFIEGG